MNHVCISPDKYVLREFKWLLLTSRFCDTCNKQSGTANQGNQEGREYHFEYSLIPLEHSVDPNLHNDYFRRQC